MKKLNVFNYLILAIFLGLFSAKTFAQNAVVTIEQDARIPELLKLKTELQKENKLTDGYTIQLYYGDLNKANSTLKDYKNKYSQWPASIEYETPNYKVWVGNYNTRLEADRALIEIQTNYPSAFILRPGKNKKDE